MEMGNQKTRSVFVSIGLCERAWLNITAELISKHDNLTLHELLTQRAKKRVKAMKKDFPQAALHYIAVDRHQEYGGGTRPHICTLSQLCLEIARKKPTIAE